MLESTQPRYSAAQLRSLIAKERVDDSDIQGISMRHISTATRLMWVRLCDTLASLGDYSYCELKSNSFRNGTRNSRQCSSRKL